MKMKIVFLLLCATCSRAIAQEQVETKAFQKNQVVAPYKVEVTFAKTVHILFPSEVKYVDLGSIDIIAGKATGAENVVRVKAAVKDFPGETNFSVITADGCFYSFDVTYAAKPEKLSIEMKDWLRADPNGEFANDRIFVKLPELGGETPVLVNKIMYNIYKKNASDIKNIGCKKFGIQALLKGIYVHNNLFYLHTAIRNNSNVSFDIDYIHFKIVDKKVVKRTAMQETQIVPVRTYNQLATVDGKTTVRNVFVLPKITIPDDKVLVVEIFERGGGRHQSFQVQNTDIVNARLVKELKLR